MDSYLQCDTVPEVNHNFRLHGFFFSNFKPPTLTLQSEEKGGWVGGRGGGVGGRERKKECGGRGWHNLRSRGLESELREREKDRECK